MECHRRYIEEGKDFLLVHVSAFGLTSNAGSSTKTRGIVTSFVDSDVIVQGGTDKDPRTVENAIGLPFGYRADAKRKFVPIVYRMLASSPGPPRYTHARPLNPLTSGRFYHVSDVEGMDSVGERDRNSIHAYASICCASLTSIVHGH